MGEKDLGEFYIDAERRVWQLITYTDQPTATLQRVDDPSIRVGGVVGAPIFQPYRRLVPVPQGDDR